MGESHDLPVRWTPLELGETVLLREGAPHRKVHIPADVRRRHMYVTGASGSGKSKFLEHLIRQDVIAWPEAQAGLVLFDPHGNLYDNLLAWLAAHPRLTEGERARPIVPLDFRGGRFVPSYDLLRHRPGADPAVVIDGLTRAIAHVWGSADTDETPRFEQWVGNVLWPLYVNGCPLTDATRLIADPVFRRHLLASVKEQSVVEAWRRVEGDRRFAELIESTVNRLQRFLRNDTLKLVFGSSSGNAQQSFDWGRALDARAIVLVNLAPEGNRIGIKDTETLGTLLLTDLWAAARQRGKSDAPPPFYCYLDEFQRFVTPDIAEGLDEARGYGLHLILSHQYPRQLLNRGEAGRRIYDAILGNAATTLAFRCRHPEDVDLLAKQLFRDVYDPDAIKREFYRTAVVGQQVTYLPSYHESVTETASWGHTTTESESTSEGTADGVGLRESASEEYRVPRQEPAPSFAQELAPFLFAPEEERPIRRSEGRDASASFSRSATATRGRSESYTEGGSVAKTRGVTLAPAVLSVFARELSSVAWLSVEEQALLAAQSLTRLREREFFVKLDGVRAPVGCLVPTVSAPAVELETVGQFAEVIAERQAFLLPREEAERQLLAVQRNSEALKELHASDAAPDRFRRRLDAGASGS